MREKKACGEKCPGEREHSKKEAGEWERELVRLCKDDGKALPETRVTGC